MASIKVSRPAAEEPVDKKEFRGPLDPRLLKVSGGARRWILILAFLTAITTLSTMVMGLSVGLTAAGIIEHPDRPLAEHRTKLIILAAAVLTKSLASWAQERFATRASAQIIVDLRDQTLRHLAFRDPRYVDAALWRTRLGEGIEGLGPYLTGYLPALASTVISIPTMMALVWWLDTPSMLIALVTLPLIPFFMWLVGTLTAGKTEKRLRDLSVLTNQLLDLVAGLTTLKVFNRHHDTALEVRRLSKQHGNSTMSVLALAFLSSFVLEFLATLSVALMAVGIGFRLLDGNMTLAAGLTVLIVAPEIYNPLREVGTRFHDAQDGLAASDAILAELSATPPVSADLTALHGDIPAVAPGMTAIFRGFSASTRDGLRPNNLSGIAEAGHITALVGPNGTGKSTALLALLGLGTEGTSGTAVVVLRDPATNSTEVRKDQELWQRTIYVPQRPRLDRTAVGETAALSQGQRQRVALYGALERLDDVTEPYLVVLDEPTAHLDRENAAIMIDALRKRAAAGHTVVVATHDPLLIQSADTTVEVSK